MFIPLETILNAALNNFDAEDEHPKDCLCGIPFIEGKSVPVEMSEELCEVLRDDDQVRFGNKAPWVMWKTVKEFALDTYFSIQIKEREPEPKKEEYYLFDRDKKALIYVGHFVSRIAATNASQHNYSHVKGTLVTEDDIILMQQLLDQI